MRLRILAVGPRQPAWVDQAVDEYRKRIRTPWRLELIVLEPATRSGGADLARVLEREGERVLAALRELPLGILGGIYLHEYGGNTARARVIRVLAEVMTGVPSIVMGLFIYVVFTLKFGLSGVGGSLALACLMLPVVIRSSEEMLRLVPESLREASYALGTSKSRTILTVALPGALPGIVSGCLLAIARAAGETAPLLFTIGAARRLRFNIFTGATTALPAQIFENAKSSFPGARERGWGAALTLVAITFIFTVTARIVTAAYRKRR